MFTSNPFSELSASISPTVMQGYIILMVLLVVGGTILDMIHKKSAQYFFENAKKAKKSAKRSVGVGEKASIAVQVLANEVLTSGEFCNMKRRLSHLLIMYGFIIFVATTHYDFWLSNASDAHACHPAATVAYRRTDVGCWWILVLVFYPG